MESLDDVGLRFNTDKSSAKHDFLDSYEEVLQPYQNQPITFIEFGVFRGASARMWAHWLPNATIVGVDIGLPKISPPANLTLVKADATSPASLNKLSRKFDRPHVVLDDASHFWSDQRKTLELFWPWLAPGGTYIIEDLHTSFEEGYSGDDLFSTFNLVTKLASGLQTREEELARFQARENPRLVGMCEQIRSITFIRRAVIMRKNSEGRPGDLG